MDSHAETGTQETGPQAVGADTVDVRVPRLGAYVLNKAVTFPKRTPRSGEVTNPKRAKDLLYLRDLVAAGDAVVQAIEADLALLLEREPQLQQLIDVAASRLESIGRGAAPRDVQDVVSALMEREPERPIVESRQDVQGHLTDLFDVLEQFRSPLPHADRDDGED